MPKPPPTQCANRRCGAVLPAGSLALTCSSPCRQAAYRARRRTEAVPAEMASTQQWVRRSASKVPLTVGGTVASSTNPSTWATYQQVKRSTVGAGLGFALTADDGIVCIDLDHCLSDGQLAAWAKRILAQAGPTFAEVSPSGTGLHIWGRGVVGRGRKIRRGEMAVEVYDRGRYIAMGQRYENAPLVLADLTGLIATLN